MLFVSQRQRFPTATVAHILHRERLDTGQTWLHVQVEIGNTGKVLLELRSARTRLQWADLDSGSLAEGIRRGEDPVADGEHEIPWPVIASREWSFNAGMAEVEPGEKECLDCDFVVPSGVDAVVLYTYVANASKKGRELGWSQTRILNFREEEEEDEQTPSKAAAKA